MRTVLTAGLIAAAAAFAAIAPAQASCFYNKSEVPNLGVSMDCGWFCRNDWSIKPGDHACRGGEGGEYWLNGTGTNPKARDSFNLVGAVDDHGYVTVTGNCGSGIRMQTWSANHQLQQDRSVNISILCK
ncbi:hypothetical protein ACM64Y_04160 [Novispirillum sp. DQ9]|uniref:hypothetical protein n=1 Tax=Novispirillum sp. DQ9 TaxID=3398612 RepID=UPI003C79905C